MYCLDTGHFRKGNTYYLPPLKQNLDWSLKTTLDQETEKVVGFEDDA